MSGLNFKSLDLNGSSIENQQHQQFAKQSEDKDIKILFDQKQQEFDAYYLELKGKNPELYYKYIVGCHLIEAKSHTNPRGYIGHTLYMLHGKEEDLFGYSFMALINKEIEELPQNQVTKEYFSPLNEKSMEGTLKKIISTLDGEISGGDNR